MSQNLGTCDQGCVPITHLLVPKSKHAYRPLPLPRECLNSAASSQRALSGISPGEGGCATAACFASQDRGDAIALVLHLQDASSLYFTLHISHFTVCFAFTGWEPAYASKRIQAHASKACKRMQAGSQTCVRWRSSASAVEGRLNSENMDLR